MSGSPIFEVPRVGVATIIWDNSNRILMGLRKGKHGAGTWSLPGGWIELGEHPEETAAREILEETNLEVEPYQIRPWERVPYTNTFFKDPAIHNITLLMVTYRFMLENVNGNSLRVKLKEPDKCEYWEWFYHYKLPTPLFSPLIAANFKGEMICCPDNPNV